MKKEECLSKAEQELEARTRELIHAKEMLQEASTESSGLQKDLHELQEQFLEVEARRYCMYFHEECVSPVFLSRSVFFGGGSVYICNEPTN